jgi:hypothetical protein
MPTSKYSPIDIFMMEKIQINLERINNRSVLHFAQRLKVADLICDEEYLEDAGITSEENHVE